MLSAFLLFEEEGKRLVMKLDIMIAVVCMMWECCLENVDVVVSRVTGSGERQLIFGRCSHDPEKMNICASYKPCFG